jgi:minor extracellular serine protease Vpr
MKSSSIWWRVFSFLALTAFLISPIGTTAPAQAGILQDYPTPVRADKQVEILEVIDLADFESATRSEDGRLRVIVELNDPPLALYEGGLRGLAATSRQATGTPKLDINSPAAQAYIRHLKGAQDAAISTIQSLAPSASTNYRYQLTMNGFGLEIAEADLPALLKAPGVKAVYPDEMQHVEMEASLDIINAPAMWAAVGGRDNAGDGIFVAVIDSGIWPEHPMFAGDGFEMPFGYPRGYCLDNPAADFQCNGKIVAARYYEPSFAIHAEEELSPRDINGHGSHTAGTAAGNVVVVTATNTVVSPTTISGVAPGAYVMAYKALFHNAAGTTASGTITMLLAALEDALADGADVINNSWGGGAGNPRLSPFRTVFESLIASDVVIVFSAGNSGPDPETIGCPGCVEYTIATAASTTNRRYAPGITLTSTITIPPPLNTPIPYTPSDFPGFTTSLTAPVKAAALVQPSNPLGCDPFLAGSFTDSIALIQRGVCAFSVKVNNAAAAGAVGVIIFNNQPGTVNITVPGTTIPSVSILESDGQELLDLLTANPTATVTATLNPNQVFQYDVQPDVLAGFSSVGPGGDPNFLKPDITAPGVNILSAYSPALDGRMYNQISGTSMAAPHVTGAVALMKELHPTWTINQIRSVLMSTSIQTVYQPDGVTLATPFNIGAGRMDLERALNAGVTFDSASFSAGECLGHCEWHNTIKNISDTTTTWQAHVRIREHVSIAVTPTQVTLPPGLSADFLVTIDATRAVSEWHYGEIIWRDTSGVHPDAYMPIVVTPRRFTNSTFTKEAPEEILPGEPFTYTLNLQSSEFVTSTYYIFDQLPDEVTYVDGSASPELEYDAATHSLSGQVELGPVVMSIQSVPILSSFFSLPTVFGTQPLPCGTGECDEVALTLTGLEFMYNGTLYDRLTVSTNGFVVPGELGSIIDNADENTMLPNPDSPNNMIAPLWTDLDLGQGSTGGGNWYAQFVTLSGIPFLVIEWKNVELYGDPTSVYTFQVWIAEGPEEFIFFTYNQIIGDTDFTIGVENIDGTAGSTYYFNGTGTLPPAGSAGVNELLVVSDAPETTLTFMVEPLPTLQIDTFITNEASVLRTGSSLELVAWVTTKVDFLDTYFPLMFMNGNPAP